MSEEKDYVLLFEAPKIEPAEFRLYYDDKGKVVTYTCEKLAGKYIVIDALTFAEARPDVRVVDGKLTTSANSIVVSKLTPNLNSGIMCAEEDVSIIVADSYTGNTTMWELQIYEC